jgi:hypothetical protein
VKQFALKDGNQTYNCDTDGRVSDSANVIGTWTTFKNQIRIVKQAGGKVDVPVEWRFNALNQLVIRQGGSDVFTVVNSLDGLARYRLVDNVLSVDPDGDDNFSFTLDCVWGMSRDGNVQVSIGGVASTLDGFIEDSQSRLQFQFYDKALPNFPSALVFSGQWERMKKQADATWRPIKAGEDDPEIRMHFALTKPALEDPAAPLILPASLKVDPTRNHLVLTYTSPSYGSRRLEFMGSVEITQNFTLKFRIANEKDPKGSKTRIDVETTFEWSRGQGTVVLHVGRQKSATSQMLEVAGSVQARLQNGTLTWTFAYQNSTAGGVSTITFATALRFTYDRGDIFIEYSQAGQKKRLKVSGSIVENDFRIDGGIEIENFPGGRRIGAFIGVSW